MTRSQQTDHQLCFGDCGRSTKGRWGCILKWISLEQNSFWLMQGWKLGVQTAVCNRARVTVEPSTCSYIHTAVFHWKQNYLWHFRIHTEMKTLWKHRDQWNLHFDHPIQAHFALSPLRENTSSGFLQNTRYLSFFVLVEASLLYLQYRLWCIFRISAHGTSV